jgi:hypothetical protein
MITPLGWLERVPNYKEQQENITGKDLSTYGFLGYPLLQAADILLYQPDFVPVGQDQVAHVELTREVARRFNSMYRSRVFPEPDALLTPSPKLPGTDGRKMSKSYGNTIRVRLESDIDKTWEMLRAQSTKAEARAEQTMLSVRAAFDLSRDLGSVRRHFTSTEKERQPNRDLSGNSDWWKLDFPERSRRLRDYWKNNILPFDIPLSQESNRVFATPEREFEEPFLSQKKKRVFVTTSRDIEKSNEWRFEIPAKSYEVWVFLCWHNKSYWLDDFVVPQKYYAQTFAAAKKLVAKEGKIPVTVTRDKGNQFFLSVAGSSLTAVDELRGNYEPFQ